MIGIPTARTGTLSPAPTSPTPLAGYGEPMPHTPLQAAPIYATFGDTAQASNNGLRSSSHALPRMFPVDDHEPKMTQGKLPPLNTKPVLTGIRKDLPPSDSRRSHHRPASLTHQDTSRSSLASGSSLSSQTSDVSTTSSYGVYTPMTPVEESRVQRSLPAPPSIPMSASIGGKVVDRIQAQSLQPHISTVSPSSFNPLHPPQPQYHSPSGSSGTGIHFPRLSTVYTSFGNSSLTTAGPHKDLPQERHSLKNLTLAGSPRIHPEDTHHPRSISRERAQHAPQPASSHSSSFSSQHGQASPHDSRRSLLREDSSSDVYLDSPTTSDPLSVLAYAGRLVDRDSRRSPRSPPAM